MELVIWNWWGTGDLELVLWSRVLWLYIVGRCCPECALLPRACVATQSLRCCPAAQGGLGIWHKLARLGKPLFVTSIIPVGGGGHSLVGGVSLASNKRLIRSISYQWEYSNLDEYFIMRDNT